MTVIASRKCPPCDVAISCLKGLLRKKTLAMTAWEELSELWSEPKIKWLPKLDNYCRINVLLSLKEFTLLSPQDFIRMFTIENNLIQSQTEGLSQADTLIQPQPSGNCMNWVLGHILESQVSLLTVLGGISPIDPAGLAIYQRESDPITTGQPGVLPLEHLLEQINAVHAALVACLAEMSDADFSHEIQQGERKVTLGWRLLFLHFHYTYHVGQLELLRQLAGRSEKVV